MQQLTVGNIRIEVQNDEERNEDVYRIGSQSFAGGSDAAEIRQWIIDHIEDPERFVVNEEENGRSVYTKQPDAAVQLAVFLTRAQGGEVNERDADAVRERLHRMQR